MPDCKLYPTYFVTWKYCSAFLGKNMKSVTYILMNKYFQYGTLNKPILSRGSGIQICCYVFFKVDADFHLVNNLAENNFE